MPALNRQRTTLLASALALLSLALHSLPFLYSRDPFGYDTGFYRRYLIQPLHSFPNMPVPGLGDDALIPRLVFDILRLSHLPPDIILYGSYVLLFVLLPILVFYYLLPSLGTRGSFLAALFVTLSSVSYEAYWYMFYKNAFVLNLLLLAFITLERRLVAAAIILDVLIAFSHATSAIVYLLTLGALIVMWTGRRTELAGHFALTALCFAAANIPLAHHLALALPSALFIEWPQFIWLVSPFVLLITVGWRGLSRGSIPYTLIAFAAVSIVFPVLHLPFYQRIFVFADLALAMLAGYAIVYLIERIDLQNLTAAAYVPAAALCIATGLLAGNIYAQVRTLKPLVPETSIKAIMAVGAYVPPNTIILTSANEAPLYEGWTNAHIAAPGLLHDTHDLEDWQALWDATSTVARIAFLATFPKPLYVSTLGPFQDVIGTPPSCLSLVAPNVLFDDCR